MAHILIVEDDEWLAELHVSFLTRAGYTATVAEDPFSALDAIDERLPDVIIVDVMLTGQNGITLLHEMQSHADLANIPVIMCSSVDMTPYDLSAYGVRAVLDKATMVPDDVIKAIKGVL